MSLNPLGSDFGINPLLNVADDDPDKTAVPVTLRNKYVAVNEEALALLHSVGFTDADLKTEKGQQLLAQLTEKLRESPTNYDKGKTVTIDNKPVFQTHIVVSNRNLDYFKRVLSEIRAGSGVTQQDTTGPQGKLDQMNADADARKRALQSGMLGTATLSGATTIAMGMPKVISLGKEASEQGVKATLIGADAMVPLAGVTAEVGAVTYTVHKMVQTEAQRQAELRRAQEFNDAWARYKAGEAVSLEELQSAPTPITANKTKDRIVPDVGIPTADELPKGELTKSVPTSPTPQPPTGGPGKEPPKLDPKKIVPPIIAATATTTAGILADKVLWSESDDVAPNGVQKIVKREWTQEEYKNWFDNLPIKETPINGPEDIYEVIHTGPLNYKVSGGGADYWADGISSSIVLDAKFVINAERSLFIRDSKFPDFLRARAEGRLRDEFERIGKVLHDNGNPLTSLRVITSDARAVPFFEQLMREYDIPGEVVVEPEIGIER